MKAKPGSGRPTTTASLLVQHLTKNADNADMQSVVRLLSDALDLAKAKAKAKARAVPKARPTVDGPTEPEYWVG